VLLTHDFELRGQHIHPDSDDEPEQDDRQSKDSDQVGYDCPLRLWHAWGFGPGGGVGHADFTKQ
jgi:hypothetical protein